MYFVFQIIKDLMFGRRPNVLLLDDISHIHTNTPDSQYFLGSFSITLWAKSFQGINYQEK
jgi:hypothetical protein